MKYFYGLLLILMYQIGYSQTIDTIDNSIQTKVKADTTNNLIRLEKELDQAQLRRLKNEFIERNHLFYTLEIFTDNEFLNNYHGKELHAYAFNPPWEKVKDVLRRLETDFSMWSTTYSQSKVSSKTNYLEIKRNFEQFKAAISDQFSDNCNDNGQCDKIKRKLAASREYVNQLIKELTKFHQIENM